MRVRNCPTDGMCFVDLHAEKWQLDNGEALQGDWKSFNKDKPWIAPWENGWLVFDGGQDAVYTIEKPEGDFQELPPGWYDYAEIIDEKGLQVKKPKFNVEDYFSFDSNRM